ncbi:MAG: MFS transporter [Rhodospirillales bacterium]|nr:MFS transporter [Rhodospirillales bacterium]
MARLQRRTATMLFMNVGHTYAHLFLLLYPTAVLAMGDDFPGTYGERLSLSMFTFAALAIGTLPAGWLGDRWSRRGMMGLFFIGIGTSAVLVGLAEGKVGMAVGLALIGLFSSIYHPVGTAVVVENARHLGKAIGVNGVFGNLGVALAAIVAGALSDLISWRAAFIVPGIAAAATGVVFGVFSPGGAGAPVGPAAHSADGMTHGIRIRMFAFVAVGTMCSGMTFNALTVALPKVFEERLAELAATTTEVGAWVFVVIAFAAAGQVVVGHLLDRYPLKPVYVGTVFLQVALLLLAANASGAALLVMSFVMMFLVLGETPIRDTLVGRFTSAEWRARVYAVKAVLSLGVAVAAVPLVAGVRDGTGGFLWLFLVLAIFASTTLVSALAQPTPSRPPAPST